MQTLPQNWTNIYADPKHYYECCVKIDGTYYTEGEIISMSTTSNVFGSSTEPSIGNAAAGEIDLTIIAPRTQPQPRALVIPYVKIRNATTATSWMQMGQYWIDTRELTKDGDGLELLTIHGYDTMIKAERDFPSTSATTMTDVNMVNLIASKIGAAVDERTTALMTLGYTFPIPVNYTMREVLGMIASAYCGNFIITEQGKLRLLGFAEIPEQTRYLIDTVGNSITFGGDRILV